MIKQTKIVCTLGPSSQTAEQIADLANEGMNVARINMSHGDEAQYQALIENVRSYNQGKTVPIGIMLDTKGAEIRTGERANPLAVTKGDTVRFCPPNTSTNYDEERCIEVSYDGFAEDCKETNQILLDNGELSFSIDSIESDGCVIGTAKQDGSIGSRRHINLFGALVDLPTITEKDWQDIDFSIAQNVDFLALSFIRTASDVEQVQEHIRAKGSNIQLVAKIETKQAVENIHEIITTADAIMIARGDLGAEMPYEELPTIQDRIVTLCSDAKKPVIIATQMLESMREHPMPTRAEITDVAHAAMTQTDATMLSGETASGAHPPVAVQAMSKILRFTEVGLLHSKAGKRRLYEQNKLDAKAAKICQEAYRQRLDAIILECDDMKKLLAISKQRPEIPVFHYSDDQQLIEQTSLLYGIHSFKWNQQSESSIKATVRDFAAFSEHMDALQVHWQTDEPTFGSVVN